MNKPEVHVAIIYYSATGNVHKLAEAVAQGAREQQADVILRKVPELAPPEAIAKNPEWARHARETQHIAAATLDDLRWADAVIFGTPTRYGTPAAQLKQFIDTTGPLWQQGKLADKIYSVFVSAGTKHGGLESTVLSLANVFYHWGGLIVPPGYTDPIQFEVGTPYGASNVSGEGPIGKAVLTSARHQGARVARLARALKTGLFAPQHVA